MSIKDMAWFVSWLVVGFALMCGIIVLFDKLGY